MPDPISQVIGSGVTLVMGLLAAHDRRVQIAKEENSAVQQAVAALDTDLQTIFAAANAGDMSASVAVECCQAVSAWYWQFIGPFQQGPQRGQVSCGSNSRKPGPNVGTLQGACYGADSAPCNGKSCTAGCCIGCNVIDPTLANCIWLFSQPKGGKVTACTVVGNKYGLRSRAGYVLTYKPPASVRSEEVTINKNTGVITVGATPSGRDAVISTGAIAAGSIPDSGGVYEAGAALGSLGSSGLLLAGGFGLFLLLIVALRRG